MCLAIPGKVIKIEGRKFTIEYPGETRFALDGGIPVKLGDFVMVQMGIVIKRISLKEAKTSWNAWKKF